MKGLSNRALLVVFQHLKYIMPFPSSLQNFCCKVSLKSDGLAVGSGLSQILFWPAGTWSQGPGSPEACASLLVGGLSLRVNAGPLVGGAGSWSL